jgi:hypothetical protein
VCPHISAGREYHNYTAGSAWPLIKEQFFSDPKPMGIFPSTAELNDDKGDFKGSENDEDDNDDFEEEPL